jgi:hypothetical protein
LASPTKNGKKMGSSGKKKTTMAKLARENRLRERRLNKQAKREARKQGPSDHLDATGGCPEAGMADSAPPDPTPAAVDPSATGDRDDAPIQQDAEPIDPRAKEVAVRRLRDAPDEELAVFAGTLRDDALWAGATEREMRDAQRDHPGHGA